MRKVVLLFLLGLTSFFGFSQAETYTTAYENFMKEYNAGNFEGIFNSFTSEMKGTLPLEKAIQFFKGLKDQGGKIDKFDFEGYSQGTFAEYKTKFEKAIFSVNMSVAENGKINGLFIKPYDSKAEITSKGVNDLANYPRDIAEIIFSLVQDFPNYTQLAIAIIENGKTKNYGIIKINDTVKPIENRNKVFEIGSITKVFTATVLASLVEEGKIKLLDDINTYYPFPFHNNFKISFESLANHTSGLPALPDNLDSPNPENPYSNYDVKKLDVYLKDLLELENSTQKYSYSNLGAGLLGHTLALSQNTTFKDLLRSRILNKYNLVSTILDGKDSENRISGRNAQGLVTSNWDFDVLFGAGGMLSTTQDMVKFICAGFNPKNKELALTRIPTFKINDNLEMGLGWHIQKKKGENDLYWHNGGTGGYRSILVFDPQAKNGVVVLSNVSAFHSKSENIDKLGFNLMKEIGASVAP